MKFVVFISAAALLVSGASAAWCRDCNYYNIVQGRCDACSKSEIYFGSVQRCVNCGSSCPVAQPASDFSGSTVYEC
ncbi:uncharacterized protein ColSpa_03451 [Colletotrichum spaethianum]|uniref:Uncharacterized protein n=1 Tax=Colletotrichum spaethianum TaxID=700344 RepID=A0AA37LC61_9PEZI|nr:uncharacterized protein ColSpa_03451 [Colletotrichum spaethianum]GKT43270.1 hypothetical protein ColSpa_03451 [Colletotrichum spaethianum]